MTFGSATYIIDEHGRVGWVYTDALDLAGHDIPEVESIEAVRGACYAPELLEIRDFKCDRLGMALATLNGLRWNNQRLRKKIRVLGAEAAGKPGKGASAEGAKEEAGVEADTEMVELRAQLAAREAETARLRARLSAMVREEWSGGEQAQQGQKHEDKQRIAELEDKHKTAALEYKQHIAELEDKVRTLEREVRESKHAASDAQRDSEEKGAELKKLRRALSIVYADEYGWE